MNSFKDVHRPCEAMKSYVREEFTNGDERFEGYDDFTGTIFRLTGDLSEDITSQIFDFIAENIDPFVFDTNDIFAESVILGLEERIDNFFMQIIKQEIDNSNLSWEPSNLFGKEVK